jgi:hypothetical protein
MQFGILSPVFGIFHQEKSGNRALWAILKTGSLYLRICGIGVGGLVDELPDAAVRVVDGPPRRVADVRNKVLESIL